MSLSGQQRKQLQSALIDAFPTTTSLEQMLSHELDKNLREIAGEGSLQVIVFQLIRTANSQGWIEKLISAACESNPGNQLLKAITLELLQLEPPAVLKQSPSSFAIVAESNAQQQAMESFDNVNYEYDLFISHASEDKESFVRPLAQRLIHEYNYKVWYDEFSLRLGDRLRRSIDKGLANARYGIVVLSPNFFNKEWPQRELDGLAAREIKGTKVILPIWHEVTFDDVVRCSPTLADRLAVSTSRGMDYVVSQIVEVLQEQSSKETVQPPQTDNLRSDRAIDYTRLRDLLKAGNWKDADYETYVVMHKVLGREKNDWIKAEELLHFPCTDLRTIDSLWVKYSNGRFGFSVQKKIYLSVGGKPDGKYYDEDWKKFGDAIGWRKGWFGIKKIKQWISLRVVTYSTSAPVGHLPFLGFTGWFQKGWFLRTWT